MRATLFWIRRHPARRPVGQRLAALLTAALVTQLFLRATSNAQEQVPAAPQGARSGTTGGVARRPANRLAKETSPYLLLHAHNPVDWYPWGEEALAKARTEHKLIFLSIGYSSCYWCHVMERQSFEDEAIAAQLNKHFVCIKVDREERPDIDHIYMTALGVLGRRGGWPLTMILTPTGQPIIGGTYFPPRDKEVDAPATASAPPGAKQRMTGLTTFLTLVTNSWEKNPQELLDYAQQVSAAVKRALRSAWPSLPHRRRTAWKKLSRRWPSSSTRNTAGSATAKPIPGSRNSPSHRT